MGEQTFRVFLSAASGEFALARSALAADLRARGLEVKVQDNFRQESEADTTLRLLHDYVRDCSAVVCLIGRRSGSWPPAPAAAPFAALLPPALSAASYTQWELIFARHYNKRLSVYVANADYPPDRPTASPDDDPAGQTRFVEYLFDKGLGLNRSYFSTTHELCRLVLKETWPDHSRPKPIALPYPTLGTLFKGRDDFLAALRAAATRPADGRPRATAVAGKAVHGLGGVGKTRLAVEYAWRHEADYSALLFAGAATPQDLRRNLAAFAAASVLDLPEQAATEEDAKVAAVLRWLHDHPGWLLILDNLDTPEARDAADGLLAQLRGGHVLLTGRVTQWAAGVERMELDVLDEPAAARFLLERTDDGRRRQGTDDADAAELARTLGGLALALEQAGAFVVHRRLSLADYLGRWRSHLPAVDGWYDPKLMRYPKNLAVTWETTLDQLTPAHVALLRLLSYLAPEPAPLFVLEGEKAQAIWQEAVALLCEEQSAAAPAAGEALDALADVANYSMARWDAAAERASVHRLVQEVVRSRVPPERRTAWLTLALRLLEAATPAGDPDDPRIWPRWNPLRPHVAYVVEQADAAGIAESAGLLMSGLATLLYAKALHAEAEPLLRRALAADERDLGPDHPTVAIGLNNLAALLQATNRAAEAEPLMRRALAIDEGALGPSHPNVAIRLNNLAALLQATNRAAEAEPLIRRALAIDEGALGPDHPNVATRLNNLAQLLNATNRTGEAEPLMRRVAGILERSLGPDHPAVATALNNLASLLLVMNRVAEAEPLMQRALAADERSLGPDHPEVARDLNNLAQLLQATNRAAEAEPLMRRVTGIFERSLGPDHPNVATALNNLARLLQATNRAAEAEPLMRRALTVHERSLGPDHPSVATDVNNLALLLYATNRVAEVEPLMRRALLILLDFTRRNGHEHPHLRGVLGNFSALLTQTGRTEAEAEAEIGRLRAGEP